LHDWIEEKTDEKGGKQNMKPPDSLLGEQGLQEEKENPRKNEDCQETAPPPIAQGLQIHHRVKLLFRCFRP
jgi:hypothetical protein